VNGAPAKPISAVRSSSRARTVLTVSRMGVIASASRRGLSALMPAAFYRRRAQDSFYMRNEADPDQMTRYEEGPISPKLPGGSGL
jgi:hypothetical protein